MGEFPMRERSSKKAYFIIGESDKDLHEYTKASEIEVKKGICSK